jgi:hypothetical protein
MMMTFQKMANATPAEKEANRAVLTAMEYARHHANAESEIAAILQIAQEASRAALSG